MAKPLVVMAGLDPRVKPEDRLRPSSGKGCVFFPGSPAQGRWWHRRCDRPLRPKGEIYLSL